MIISPGRQFVFVHIPKTGGTSMALALESRAHRDDILIGDTPKAQKRKGRLKSLTAKGWLWKHSTLADMDGVLPPRTLSAMFVFTLVRNPWDRMVSYYHWLRDQRFDHPAVTLARSVSFDAFVLHDQTRDALSATPYSSYMRPADGTDLLCHYIRLEHLAADIAPLEAHLGFSLQIPHVNRSNRPADYRRAYTDETRTAVENICAQDIAQFHYQF
ncbi:sulfotransferase family 2 domain-containing protein [Marivita sp. S0852]|uniref:sulfotransferase family 2 domain-containing protein n=1 Tax=Marivita sp. S0852 TaxID=3373893 RepID=UPI003982D27C